MTDDRDSSRVTLESDAAILFWTRLYGATHEELEEAVEIVGDDADAVAAYLNVRPARDAG